MRLAKSTRTLLQLTILGSFAVGTAAQTAALPSRVRDQLNQPASTGSQQPPAPEIPPGPKLKAPAAPKPAGPQAKAPAAPTTPVKAPVNAPVKAQPVAQSVGAKAPAKPQITASTAKGPAKPAEKSAANANGTKGPAVTPVDEKVTVARRDPFDSLLTKARPGNGTPENLPPGKAGLMVGTVQITGIIHSGNGMIAIVANPQQRVYFLREGDKLYDGSVDHITLEAVSFHETGKDAFGKPIERQVTKRLYPTPGEEQ